MFKYIEAPELIDINEIADKKILFLAGGITNCANWQEIVSNSLSDIENLVILNPRRKIFEGKNLDIEQITWEHNALNISTHICFWFSKETVCPITLFELGKILGLNHNKTKRQRITIGCDKDYCRKEDVKIQFKLMDSAISYTDCSFDSFIYNIRDILQRN